MLLRRKRMSTVDELFPKHKYDNCDTFRLCNPKERLVPLAAEFDERLLGPRAAGNKSFLLFLSINNI